jgi:hypothetical protein
MAEVKECHQIMKDTGKDTRQVVKGVNRETE